MDCYVHSVEYTLSNSAIAEYRTGCHCYFLASDFLKRDKKLDTSEVFYVRPLSNAEYVIGKIWGNLRVFLLLNLIIMGITMAFNLTVGEVDWIAYLLYFLLISVPTLVFIIGLSIFLMLVLKNQALTFVILLGYIGLTVFILRISFITFSIIWRIVSH